MHSGTSLCLGMYDHDRDNETAHVRHERPKYGLGRLRCHGVIHNSLEAEHTANATCSPVYFRVRRPTPLLVYFVIGPLRLGEL